ncbi:BREX system P-loop protein BrxC [Kaistella flava (ex Peng et al. 2021)]|uniref:BREX system P-loop protein BrxC n=1 Tax=Kaistella flava (ex Peng et al. 2021) TaxID=2038776 RepID=A0A7M2Y841_9FLAO|nr:BREX system P-loop protein BrxC [Kaistella flava (ex Peng et al. 2021)]QOW09785.1 BREX system P-loop protein BrxC [Kaistella flava (ex Peng et al. 2021)]
MTKIREIFGADKNIYRSIEKVVTFGNATELNLKNEISEYVVTDRLKDNFDKILDALHHGMGEKSTEVGIWVSGFYGSGKSSFAKYLGYGLQKDYTVDGQLFLDRLSNRINSIPTSQLFKRIVENYDPAVVLLDCATEQIKGGTLPPILELLIAKVNQLAGYSTDGQLANLEQMLQKDGKLDTFINEIQTEHNEDWHEIKMHDQLKAKGIASTLAANFYPKIWRDDKSFKTTKVDDMRTDKQKIEELLSTIRKITGKENIIFVVDEVGQYISAKESLILSLQGTLENLKDIGGGKAWLLATAQQTLTEDNPNSRLNSDKLYKLKDRFPIKAEIEASDIKEICTQRILGKSPTSSDQLKQLYKAHGEKLRHYTKLEKCERTMYSKDDLDEQLFTNLYPFLPQHFEIIISLLGRLAKITGGVGLRSAIKVIQDVLTAKLSSEDKALAEFDLGKLATAYHIYDVLKADIRKSYSHIVGAVDKIAALYGESSEHAQVAKSIAVLQLLDDFYLSTKNVAVLMHPNATSDSVIEKVTAIVDELKNTPGCTLNEIDGELRFMTDAIINIEIEKNKILPTSSEIRKVYEDIIKDIFSPVPQARLLNTKTVRTGINLNQNGKISKLLEPNEEIQTDVIISNAVEYSQLVIDLIRNSTDSSSSSKIFLIGKIEKNIDDNIMEIVKNEAIYSTRNKYNDKEITDYLNSQKQEASRLKELVTRVIVQAFEKGEFVFRGSNKPVTSYGNKFRDCTNSKLSEVANLVYDKYIQAPINIGGSDAEKLLNFPNLKVLPSSLNHFDLIKGDGSIELDKESLKSIREFIIKEDQVEGRKLLEHFDAAPYGWSKDTTRFLISAMFIASDVKLRISGEDIKVVGPKAIEALKNVNGFSKIAISAFQANEKPSAEMVSLSIQRLGQLTGKVIAPLPDKIAEAVRHYFPEFQTKYSSVKTKLQYLGLPGQDKAQEVQDGIAEILKGEGSDAAFRLGKPVSDLFTNLIWIAEVQKGFDNGIEESFIEANDLKKSISELPDSGLLKDLKENAQNDFDIVHQITNNTNFVSKISDLKEANSNIKNLCSDYSQKLLSAENENITAEISQIKSAEDWSRLKEDQQKEIATRLEGLKIENQQGLEGIKNILKYNYTISNNLKEVREQITEYTKIKPVIIIEPVVVPDPPVPNPNPEPTIIEKSKVTKSLSAFSKTISSQSELNLLIEELQNIKEELDAGNIIEITW